MQNSTILIQIQSTRRCFRSHRIHVTIRKNIKGIYVATLACVSSSSNFPGGDYFMIACVPPWAAKSLGNCVYSFSFVDWIYSFKCLYQLKRERGGGWGGIKITKVFFLKVYLLTFTHCILVDSSTVTCRMSICHFRGRRVYYRYVVFVRFLMEYLVSKQCRHWSDATSCGVWSGSALFAYGPFTGLQVRMG